MTPTYPYLVAAVLGAVFALQDRTQQPQPPALRMQIRAGYGPQGGKVLEEFTVQADGTFRFGKLQGKLPARALEALITDVQKATPKEFAEDAGTVEFTWPGKDGKDGAVLFTLPREPLCVHLVERVRTLARDHADKGKDTPK
jgi:hypothetical protein